LTQKFVFKKILLYIFKVQEIRRKSTGNFPLFPKLAKFGHIYHKIWGYFSQGKCTLSENDTGFSWTLLIKYSIKLKIKWNIPDFNCTENATECSVHYLWGKCWGIYPFGLKINIQPRLSDGLCFFWKFSESDNSYWRKPRYQYCTIEGSANKLFA
jgi:hypothetical protein